MAKDILYPLRRLHGKMHEAKITHDIRKNYKLQFKEHPNSVFLIMTPEHGNLGDHAIALAVTGLLKKNDIRVVEITDKKLREMVWLKQIGVFNGMPIIVNGGGNLGTLWFNVEQIFRTVIASNPKSKIMLLPNTIFYEDSEYGNTEFKNSQRIYNKHRSLYLYAREKISYDVMKDAYNNVKLIPDMVLALDQYKSDTMRNGGILCLRKDLEKTCTSEQKEGIFKQMQSLFGNAVTESDTVLPGDVTVEQRKNALDEKFSEFAQAELVVTDRLHGMIFCAVTGTPCVVIDSKSPKLRGCYEWIRHLDYIRFIDDPAELTEAYHSIPKTKHCYDNRNLQHYYDELTDDILNLIKK